MCKISKIVLLALWTICAAVASSFIAASSPTIATSPTAASDLPTIVITAQPTAARLQVSPGEVHRLSVSAASVGGQLDYQWFGNSRNSITGAQDILDGRQAWLDIALDKPGTTYYFCMIMSSSVTDTVFVHSNRIRVDIGRQGDASSAIALSVLVALCVWGGGLGVRHFASKRRKAR
jgi:hypothetical protein